jgi:nucleotide-binding universal stress UspA family protein
MLLTGKLLIERVAFGERGQRLTTTSPLPRRHDEMRRDREFLRFRSILVATDCSAANVTAVKQAARLAKQFHARLCLLHAVAPQMYVSSLAEMAPSFDPTSLEIARENLHAYAERIDELRTMKREESAFLGSAAEAIQASGEANHIDLLVVGSHGRQGLAKLALGSVAEWAIRRLHYPVLVAGPMCAETVRGVRSIVLATDLSEQGLRSVQYASAMAQDYNARFTVLHVLPRQSTAEEQSRAEWSAKERLRQLVPSDAGDWCTPKFEVKTGDIAASILNSARDSKADMIVLGARHKPSLADHLPRTKVAAVIGGAHCPVLVVPPQSS